MMKKDRKFMAAVAESRVLEVSAKSKKLNEMSNRKLLEFCCSEESLLGHRKYVRVGCHVIRLTAKHDLTTQEGLDVAMNAAEGARPGQYLHLWGSLPCTAGSPWQRMNKLKGPATIEKIEGHKKIFKKLIVNFCKVAEVVVQKKGDISFEWPSGCSLWNEPEVGDMLRKFSMNKVEMHGCAAGLKSDKSGKPIKKPWTIATTSPAMIQSLKKFKCPGPEVHPEHEPCAGAETKKSELYTIDMTDAIHDAIHEESITSNAKLAMASVNAHPGEHDDAHEDLKKIPDPSGHREKLGPEGLWCAMITKTLEPGDPLNNHPNAVQAVMEELEDLRRLGVWDELHAYEAVMVAKLFPDAHLTRVFPIVGIKHFEDPEMQRWKGRIVVSGDRIKTVTGQWAMFQEVGSIPSTMSSCRCILALYALSKGYHLLQSDCVRAYTQALMKGPRTFIRLPKAWWPADWVGRFRDPVCELKLALYGHPHAGDFWYDKLESELKRLTFVTVEGWPSVFVLYPDETHTIAFVIYVDDLVMTGPDYIMTVIQKLRESINMEDPGQMQKYLGCVHHITQKMNFGETITEIRFDMIKYFENAVTEYEKVKHEKISKVDSPYAPRVGDAELERLLAESGNLAGHAASLVMRLMYGVRMAAPHLSVAVNRLASLITKWSGDADRKLHRIFSYLSGANRLTLMGELSTADKDSVRLAAWPDADFAGDYMSTKSTSGYYLELFSGDDVLKQNRCFPISWGSNKQGCTSQHTGESEVVSLASCLRKELLPTQLLMEKLLRRPVDALILEDNNAAITAVNKGYSPNMRHLPRTQKTSIGLLHEIIVEEDITCDSIGKIELMKVDTKVHKGDMFTKELEVRDFAAAVDLLGMKMT